MLTIMAMVGFVFLDPLMKLMGSSGKQENPVVVETRFGNYTERDMQSMRATRDLVDLFLRKVTVETIEAQINKGLRDPRDRGIAQQEWYGTFRALLMHRTSPLPEAAAIETLVLSKTAEQMGMVVSDRAVNDLLRQLSADALTPQQVEGIITNLQPGARVSVTRLFDALRTEMAASQFRQMFAQSLTDFPPAQRFEFYSQLNRRAKAEVMGVAVADFVDKVPEPSEEEVQKLYEKYKNNFPDPASPDPGFKQPKRAAFQYFKAALANFEEQAKPEITEAEIKEYYEANKAQFRELPTETEKVTDEAKPAEGEKPTEGDKPADGEKPAEGADKPAEEAKPEVPKAEEAPQTEETPKAEAPKTEDPKPQARRSRGVMRLVSDEKTAPAEPAAEEKPADKAPEGDKPAAEKPADAAPAEGEKPAEDAAKAEGEPGKAAATDVPAADNPAQQMEEPKFQPLEKVQDTIREALARQKAREKVAKIFETLAGTMRRYAGDLADYEARKGVSPNAVAPQPLDFAALAKENGIEAKQLPLVTAAEAAQEDIGQSRMTVQDQRSRFGYRLSNFSEFAFSDSLPAYRPASEQDGDNNFYLFWKTADEAAFVPKLEDIKDKVVYAWKLIKARDLALKRAEEYATQARGANKTLKEVFGSQENLAVTETPWFSWLSTGNVPFGPSAGQPQISGVEGATNVGTSFMETVFSLAPGELGVAMNHPQTVAYVVRLGEFEQGLDQLRQDFAVEPPARYMLVGLPIQQLTYTKWLQDLNASARVKWIRPADAAVQRRASEDLPPEEMEY